MQKGGETISKFFKGALEIGTAVNEAILEKVMKVFDLNKGDDAVFRTKNGAPNNVEGQDLLALADARVRQWLQ